MFSCDLEKVKKYCDEALKVVEFTFNLTYFYVSTSTYFTFLSICVEQGVKFFALLIRFLF